MNSLDALQGGGWSRSSSAHEDPVGAHDGVARPTTVARRRAWRGLDQGVGRSILGERSRGSSLAPVLELRRQGGAAARVDAAPASPQLAEELLPFDSILIDGASPSPVPVADFFALPLAVRVRLIMERRLQFFRGERQIERGIGLRSLMNAARRPVAI